MKIQPRYAPHLQGRVGPAAAQDRPEGHGRRAHARARRRPGGSRRAAVIPVSQTLPDVNLDEILATLDADTRDFLVLLLNDGAEGLGSEAKGRELAQAIRRLEPTAKYSREINEQLAVRRKNLARVVHNFSLLTDELGQRDTQLANFVQNSNAVFDTLASQDVALRADPAEAAGDAADHAGDARQGRHVRAGPRADARVAAPGGARARPVAAPDAPVPARLDADHPRRDPPLHARGAADGAGAAPGDARPGGVDAGPDGVVLGPQPAAEHGRLQPAGRPRGGLPLLAVVGQPRRQRDLLHRRRARADPARPRRAVVLERAAAGRGRRQPTRSWARSSGCSTRPRRQQICPQSTAPPASGGTGG